MKKPLWSNVKKSWLSTSVLIRTLIFWAITQAIFSIFFYSYLDHAITIETSNFLSSSIQATAAIVSIIFALSIIAIEHSASNYSSTMLDFFKKDYFVWFTAGYGLFTIGFMGATIMFNWNLAFLCFIFFLWNLALLGIYLRYTLDMINPKSINRKIRHTISKTFKKISKKINEITNERIKNNAMYRDIDPSMVKSMVIDSNNDLLNDVKKYETSLQYVILSAHRKQEYESTNEGLLSYPEIIKHYLLLNPNHYWPNDLFLELIRERVKEYAKNSLRNDDSVFLKQIIDASTKIGYELTVIKNLDSPMAYNEPLVLLIYALKDICEKCIRLKNWEGVLQITRALGSLGNESITKSGKDGQAGNQILAIGKSALIEKDTFSCFTCINQIFKIFQKRALLPPDTMLDSDFEELGEFVSISYHLPQSSFHGNSFFFEGSGINPIEYAKNAIIACEKNLSEETEIIQRSWRIQNLKKHLSLIIKFVGKIDHWNANDMLMKIIILYLQKTQQMFHDPFTHKEEIENAINGLSSNNRKGNSYLAELSLICLQNQYDDTAIKCIERISLVAKNMIKNDENGYDSNRAIRELNLIGCYLQLHPNVSILDKVIEKILEFDEQFEDQYDRTARDELSLDLPEWASPSWASKYKNLDNDWKNEIMHIDNRIKFEKSVVEAKINHLK
ncbi:hypothetical protein K0U27_09790 [archaeon]|nr:hypothetical protein [archaeon]